MAKANMRYSKRKLIRDPRKIPPWFRSRAAEAMFWETHDFAAGILADGERVRKELDELLGLEDE